MADAPPIDLANEAYLLAHGWSHCLCPPPRNWAHSDIEAAVCWPIQWALEEQADREFDHALRAQQAIDIFREQGGDDG